MRNSSITDLNDVLTSHKSSADHDGRYYTETEVNNLLSGKSPTSHTHDGRYYTEAEVNTLLNSKAASNHNHNGVYVPINTSSQTITSTSYVTSNNCAASLKNNFFNLAICLCLSNSVSGTWTDYHIVTLPVVPGYDIRSVVVDQETGLCVPIVVGNNGKLYLTVKGTAVPGKWVYGNISFMIK